MSISISWYPVVMPKPIRIEGTSKFWDILNSTFDDGKFPGTLTLNRSDIRVLNAIAACGFNGASELRCALDTYEEIEVRASW